MAIWSALRPELADSRDAAAAAVAAAAAAASTATAAHPPPSTPTALRPSETMSVQTTSSHADSAAVASSPTTPTRHGFGRGLSAQRPLPDDLPAHSHTQEHGTPSIKRSAGSDDTNVDMADAEDDERAEDDNSDNDSVTSDSQRPSKKKKGQRFFCTEFPPCQLSFTRSEHLARHIRKHTGERPFQCHCSRRFSRLDNLRQHAQTVHVNEDIPGDSLAATSTRFQRQIRTDRVRPAGGRSRASTLGSQSGHSRGHSRNLSSSSIASTVSSVASEDPRRHPQPLAMANESSARARLSLESYGNGPGSSSPGQQYAYYHSPGYATPTSTFSGGQSPHFSSVMGSPSSTFSRSIYYNGARMPGRRLSVPSGQSPYHSSNTYPPVYFSPPSSAQPATFSPSGSVFTSPTSSVFSHSRQDSEAESEYRRRTWHPSTNSHYTQRPATSGLTYHQTPDEPQPAFTQQHAASQMRLPGIESFDHAPPGSRQPPSPMMVDASPPQPAHGRSDAGLQQGLTRLDITAANASEGQWKAPPLPHTHSHQQLPAPSQFGYAQHASMPEQPVTPRNRKRNAWYGGPLTPTPTRQQTTFSTHRPSPEDSGSSDGVPTPSTSQGTECNPVIVNPNGEYPASSAVPDEHKMFAYAPGHQSRADSGYQQYATPQTSVAHPLQAYALQSGHDPQFAQSNHSNAPSNDMAKLEALVAVATSEGSRAEHGS